MLPAKVLEAQNLCLKVNVEIPKPIDLRHIDTLDFIRIMTILLDNAIEAAIESRDKEVSLAFLDEKDKVVIVIKNTTKQKRVSYQNIFNKGISSKGYGRGIGLSSVSEILDRYSYITITTTSYNFSFTQIIEIKN